MKMRAGLKLWGRKPSVIAEHDDGDERPDVRRGQQAELVEALAVEEERAGRDGHDAGGQPVEPVDEVDGVGHHDQPQHRDERREVPAEGHDVEERHPEVEHRDAEVGEHEPGHHHAGDLGRRRQLVEVVDRADEEDDRGRHHDAERLGVVGEQGAEHVHAPRHAHGGEEPEEHGQAAERRASAGCGCAARRAGRPSRGAGRAARTIGVVTSVTAPATPPTTA